jgi:hypothetical protein
MKLLDFFNLPNPASRIMTMRFTHPLTEINTSNLSAGKARLERKADNFTAT